ARIRTWTKRTKSLVLPLHCRGPARYARNDSFSPQFGEQIQERTQRWLEFVEAGQPTLGHVGHDLDLAPKVQSGVPGPSEFAEVGFGEAVLGRDLGPDRCRLRQLLLQRRRTAGVRR